MCTSSPLYSSRHPASQSSQAPIDRSVSPFPKALLKFFINSTTLTTDYFEIFAKYLLCTTVWPVPVVFPSSTPLPRPLMGPRISTAVALSGAQGTAASPHPRSETFLASQQPRCGSWLYLPLKRHSSTDLGDTSLLGLLLPPWQLLLQLLCRPLNWRRGPQIARHLCGHAFPG